MKKVSFLICVLLVGCNTSTENKVAINTINQTQEIKINRTPELVEELKVQPSINDQFVVLYRKFEPILDRSDSLLGPDENNDGIRDDIEAFINALEVTEPIRKVLKQDARFTQENLYYDFSKKTESNIDLAIKISDKYPKVIACKEFLGIHIDDLINTGSMIEALTFNTKERTMAYLTYNHLLDGTVSTLLEPEEKYCE